MQSILLSLFLALGLGKIAAILSARAKLPQIVGEIFIGVLLANLGLVFPGFELGHELSQSLFLRHLAEIGVLLLLFAVGLESTLGQVAKVGARASLVAVIGVVSPMALTLIAWKLGWVDDRMPDGSPSFSVAVFTAATLTATSVGVTARILADARQLISPTGQIIVNAAVIDDVLGLMVLAGVMTFVANASVSYSELFGIAGKAFAFFAVMLPVGYYVFPVLKRKVAAGATSALTVFGLCICFGLAWFSTLFGLAPIVGAFFAGLLMDDPEDQMRKRVEPIVDFLGPLFFVLIGAQVRLEVLLVAGWQTVGQILFLTVLAIFAKLVCGLVAGRGVDRYAVGMGMAPRGEVGLIFAMTGRQAGVVSDQLFGVIVLVVLLTTLVPSILLSRHLRPLAMPAS